MRWLLPTLITLPLVQGVWDTTPTEARGGCPSVYVYDLPQLWDVRVPLDELRNVSGKFVFGRPCDGGIPEEFDTDQCEIPEQFRRPIVATTAHRHFFLVGKGHVKPNKWCDAWWRAPAGLLRRAMRFAYSSGYAMVPGKNRTGYGPKRLDDDAVAASMARPTWARPTRTCPSPRRARVAAECAADGACGGMDVRAAKETVRAAPRHFCGLNASTRAATFCLEPGGDSPYRKGFYDAMLTGCVPVVFGLYNARVAPWFVPRNALVVVNETAYLGGAFNVLDLLRAVPPARVAAMRAALRDGAHRLQYAAADAPGDAFETLLRGAFDAAKKRHRDLGLPLV
ncbi:hypothetical protein JL721_5131 [Aureococcus anophagefferens]|nr:hypothetical protein JL721_5131 [Aureococcus anophagefferens]